MELMLAITISITVAAGILLVLSGELFRLVIGLAMLGSAVNLVVFMTARPGSIVPPVIEPGLATLPADAVNALPQALVLTAIVIGFALLCFSLVLAAWLARQQRHADVDRLRTSEPAATDAVKPPMLED